MNDIESDAENPNKAIERTADACRKAYDITHPANMHRFPHSADGDVRRHAHRWRYVNPISGITRGFIRTYNHNP